MAYGSKSGDIKESSVMGLLKNESGDYIPHVNLEIVELKAHTTEAKNEGDKTYQVFDIIYKNPQGETYTQRLFNPEEGDVSKQEKNEKTVSDTVTYIAKKVQNKDVELDGSKIKSWDDFTKEATAMIAPFMKGVKLALKLVGNVYNNKARLGTTAYFGWLERMDSGKYPKYSPNEVESNVEYENYFKKDKSKKGGGASETPVF
jgi:hypothetical protein